MKKTILGVFIAIVILAIGFFGWRIYKNNFQNNVKKSGFVYIPRNAAFDQVMDSISPLLIHPDAFKTEAIKRGLDKKIKAGRYKIEKGTTNKRLVTIIILGLQEPESFRIKDFDDIYQMIGRVSRKTESDSLEFVKAFNVIAHSKGLNNAEDLKPYFFADTYQFYWTITPDEFFTKFQKQYDHFWTPENVDKEEKLRLSRVQVYTLASIVQRETGGKPDEQKRVAGLYLNRLNKGMRLQSDPTVIYAIDKNSNFTKKMQRVYFKDLQIDSPYNTYRNNGLPPGPICIVTKSAVENVLNAEDNDFIYMAADPSHPGFHKFTNDPKVHQQNADAYREWLNQKQIK